ncbi:hypothetical protein C1645_823449 [Glomus cerebriforme]|uniref:Uncharacterized protein n=1 Tax=Glomus cerebriforme TaxID=658196 RepID=A0A397T2S1_9GLOM|nr:hypothetical protein C1645_823449 [Glomus cerebriforme]
MSKHQIFYFPGAKECLKTICELKYETSTVSTYFYGLAIQKDLKYFEWKDEYEDFFTYKEIIFALEKKGNIREILMFKYYDYYEYNLMKLIGKIIENCPLIEHLSLAFPPIEQHFSEFEKLLRSCQNLKSLLLIISNINEVDMKKL